MRVAVKGMFSNLQAMLVLLLTALPGYAAIADLQEALNVLTKNRPFPEGTYVVLYNNKEDNHLYDTQLQALSFIMSNPSSGLTKILIPYLNYSLSISAHDVGDLHPGLHHEDVAETENIWPAFAAILKTPDASSDLKKYILDKGNPINYRLTAFLVLRYVDKTSFESLATNLNLEFKLAGRSTTTYLKDIEDGSQYFWGVPQLK